MVQALHSLRSGFAALHPRSGMAIEPQPVVILEEPFGRARQEISSHVDFVAHIHLPLDVVIIRLVRRMLAEDALCAEAERQGCRQIVENLFRMYLNDGWRELMQHTEKLAADSADVVLDGMQDTEDLAAQIIEAVKPQVMSAE